MPWLLLWAGCNVEDDGTVTLGGENISEEEENIDDGVPARDADATYDGNLSDGSTIDLTWASDGAIACFPGTFEDQFTGAHVFFYETQAAGEDLYFRVVPESADVSLYALQVVDEAYTPPDVPSARSCESSYEADHGAGGGSTEVVWLVGHNEYEVTIGVAGADGATAGAFTLEVWHEAAK